MIIADTNIISEWMKPIPDSSVITWLDKQEATNLFITTISIAEIYYGLNALPLGNRRQTLEKAFSDSIMEAFQYRILAFDEKSAQIYGYLMGHRKSLGRPLSILDGQIASIASANKMHLATRNTRDFYECSIQLINPFDD